MRYIAILLLLPLLASGVITAYTIAPLHAGSENLWFYGTLLYTCIAVGIAVAELIRP